MFNPLEKFESFIEEIDKLPDLDSNLITIITQKNISYLVYRDSAFVHSHAIRFRLYPSEKELLIDKISIIAVIGDYIFIKDFIEYDKRRKIYLSMIDLPLTL